MPDYLHEIEAQLAALHTAAQQGEMITPEQIQAVRESVKNAKLERAGFFSMMNFQMKAWLPSLSAFADIMSQSSEWDEQKRQEFPWQWIRQTVKFNATQIKYFLANVADEFKETLDWYSATLEKVDSIAFAEDIRSSPILWGRMQESDRHFHIEAIPPLPAMRTVYHVLERVVVFLIENTCKYATLSEDQVITLTMVYENNKIRFTLSPCYVYMPSDFTMFFEPSEVEEPLVARLLHALGSQLDIQPVNDKEYSLAFEIPVWEE